MNTFSIFPNKFLSKAVPAFYHTDYTGFNGPNNPNYINILKNIFGKEPVWKLRNASQKLGEALTSDFPEAYRAMSAKRTINNSKIVVCSIPRSKTERYFNQRQRLFRATLNQVVSAMSFFENGVDYIQRIKETKTTHFRKEGTTFKNIGVHPYQGITLATCEISSSVAGKDILLVDDVYTAGVNVAEDVIEALYSKGAKSVSLYVIGKTRSTR